jgi:hypothetical protein
MVKRHRMSIGVNAINKSQKNDSRMTTHHFRGFWRPTSMSGMTLSRIMILLLLLVPQIAQTKVTKSKGKIQGPYSQNFIFFVTYEWVQLARIVYRAKLERLASDKLFSLLDAFISYEENEVFGIRPQNLIIVPRHASQRHSE